MTENHLESHDEQHDEKDGSADNSEFARMLESSMGSGIREGLHVGDKVTGRVIAIGQDNIFVDTGTKIDGVVEKGEVTNEKGELEFKMGDTIELYVVSANENEIRLSKAFSSKGMAGEANLGALIDAYRQEVPVEGKVLAQCKGGFHVQIMEKRAFCPISQIDSTYVKTPEDYVGGVYTFLLVSVEERGRNVVVSRRKLLDRETAVVRSAFLETLSVGQVVEGRVVRLAPYGAFVELAAGVDGMVHVSELSWARVESPDSVVRVGDTIKAKVISIKSAVEGSGKGPNISLSMKQIMEDPWARILERFTIGNKVPGKVTRCADFGAFVEIAPGVDGLVHISEMSYTKRIVNPLDVVSVGQEVTVAIKEIDPSKKRISLSLREAEGDPWADIETRYLAGQTVEGTVEKKQAFGYFISLEPGITGLLPKSKIAKANDPNALQKLKEGEKVTVVVEEIRARERKISLAPIDAAEQEGWHEFVKDARVQGAGPVGQGTLAEKLQQAFNPSKTK